ncbi:MAG TPA: DUF72 domain-containing protein [Thermoplasmata archaeon]|nr:DUF72 domain-containing protein [Thermoplasmata archaeon]
MGRILAGAGGWGYFSGGLVPYARAFPFVEVNATFYRRVSESGARRWRASVPREFTFSVKAHRDVTHGAGLRATPAARAAFAATARVASILRAPFVVLETPASLALGPDELAGLRAFAEMTPEGVRLGLEARAYAEGPLPASVARTLEEHRVLDVVDLSRSAPRVEADVVYTRLFGKGKHNVYEFDDEELQALDRSGRDAETVAYAFHGVRMYKDAARFLTFRRTGSFPPATGSVGLDSLAEVLAPDARFPATREELVRDQGWKVIDLRPDRRAHAWTILSELPVRLYRSLDDVRSAASGNPLFSKE